MYHCNWNTEQETTRLHQAGSSCSAPFSTYNHLPSLLHPERKTVYDLFVLGSQLESYSCRLADALTQSICCSQRISAHASLYFWPEFFDWIGKWRIRWQIPTEWHPLVWSHGNNLPARTIASLVFQTEAIKGTHKVSRTNYWMNLKVQDRMAAEERRFVSRWDKPPLSNPKTVVMCIGSAGTAGSPHQRVRKARWQKNSQQTWTACASGDQVTGLLYMFQSHHTSYTTKAGQ